MNRLFRLLICLLPFVSFAESILLPQMGDTLQVNLKGLLQQNPETPGRVLQLEFNRLGDHWFMGGGQAPSYNRGNHRAVIQFSEEDSLDAFRLRVDVQGDAWVSGGFVDVTVNWTLDDGETFVGTYEGVAMDEKVSGVARGAYIPAPAPLPGLTAARRGEHPRLLFKAADLPALREKAATDFGQEALAHFEESAVGLGVLYQLHEDPAYAERAMEAVKIHMADMESGNKSIRHRFWGYRLEQVALAYDLCYHAWPENFRVQVRSYIRSIARRMHRERGSWTEYVQWHPENAYNASMIYSGLIGLLAIADAEGPAPVAPAAPEVERLAPKAWTPEVEVPLVEVEADQIPARIWYSGPVSSEQFHAFREAGGDLNALNFDKDAVRILDRDPQVRGIVNSGYTGGRDVICVNQASGTAFDSWNVFAARWRVEEAGTYHYRSHHGGVVPFLNGTRVGNSSLLRLEPGEYALVFAAPLGRPNPWAGVFVRPTLTKLSDAEVEELQATQNRNYARALLFYRQDKADWEQLAGVDPATSSLLRDSVFWFRSFEDITFGAAGSQIGSTNSLALEGGGLMATVYRNVTARPLGRSNGIAYWLPRKLMAWSWTAEGEEVHQDFFGRADFETLGFQDERDNRGLVLAGHFPTVAPAFQPLAWWFWRQSGNPFEARGVPQANRLVAEGHPGTSYNSIPVYAFLHAPLDLTPRAPSESLPRTWHDPVTGDFIFRNAAEDERDVVLQLTAQQVFNRGGSQTSGSFALRGLGHNWTHDQVVNMTSMAPRNEHPVVQTRNPDTFHDGRGRVLSSESYADGSGVVRMDLSKAYRTQSEQVERRRDARDNTGFLYPEALADDGGAVWVTRTILVDYSGAAGVPAVIILLDDVVGVEDHFWSWPLSIDLVMRGNSPGRHAPNPIVEIEIEQPEHVHLFENGFRLQHGEQRLTTRFITDEELEVGLVGLRNIRHIVHSRCQVRTRNLLRVEGTDQYLAVMTLGEGEPPEIETEQKGEILHIRIGDAAYVLEAGQLSFTDREDDLPFPPLGR